MNITFDQALAFDAVASLGTVQKAAKSLHKGHSAILYSINSLETQTGVKLFDRSGYRNRITVEGEIVLKYCRTLIQTRNELELVCKNLKQDWEPSIKLIYDGVVDFEVIGDALFRLSESHVPTEINVLAAYLHEVENSFEEEKADMMVTVVPIKNVTVASIALKPIRMLLVAHRTHPLSAKQSKRVTAKELKNHTFIQIRTDSNALGLSTGFLEHDSSFQVNDFASKKQAIMKSLGYGWLPEYMIETELQQRRLNVLRTENHIESEHVLKPRLYHRKEEALGKTAVQLLKYFKS
ncbi:MAG: LysR family transcriptional regulator [Deltaproteobacteria bacterium]|jgi:DNA-binding transcriptional LysR family regulator|nr:LysR family transcriptional regulator [Deltaproteobacteria bacterium]